MVLWIIITIFFIFCKNIVFGKYAKLFFHNLREFLKNDYLRTVFFYCF